MSPRRNSAASARGNPGVRWRAVLVVAAIAMVYANSLAGPFLLDDDASILNNAQIRQVATALSPPRDAPVAGQPLVNLSFAVNLWAGGLETTGYHVVNIAIHVAAAIVLFGLVRRTLLLPSLTGRFGQASQDIALACALIWGLHPLNSEAVNYLSARSDSLMGLFYLLTLYGAVRGWRVTAIVTCAAGMLCNTSMVTAPLLVVLYERVFVFDSAKEAFRQRRGFYGGLAATWVLPAVLSVAWLPAPVAAEAGTTPWLYFLNQAEIVSRYIALSFWPCALVLDYGVPRALAIGDVALPALVIVALIALTITALRYVPMAGFLGAAFFVILAPPSSLIPIAGAVGAERRMYLPLAALMVLVVMVVARELMADSSVPDPPRVKAAPDTRNSGVFAFRCALGVVCLLLAAGTFLRNREYASRLTMAETIVERRPHARGRFFLGMELIAAGQQADAVAQLQAAAPEYPRAHFALATQLLSGGRPEDALPELQAFLKALPDHPSARYAHDMLGRVYIGEERYAEAVQELRLLAAKFPGFRGMNNDIELNLGYALAASGRLAEALPVIERAVTANPENAKARDLLVQVRAAAASPRMP
ncbi:MAG: tetratricopeptide repeat protein [Acidobacteria bacterium]|nr:tetratricopeptide repeat protein [Acidobacteriota bacterium]